MTFKEDYNKHHNNPIVVKYIDEIMPIIINTCCKCNAELFKSISYESITPHRNFCFECYSKIEEEIYQFKLNETLKKIG